MKNSASFSAPSPESPPGAPLRRSFALTGPRRPLDAETEAFRRDLADIRLAEYVFAPHYAAPLAMIVTSSVPLRSGPGGEAPVIAMLETGDRFEALDFAGTHVWGKAARLDRVGYVAQTALMRSGDDS